MAVEITEEFVWQSIPPRARDSHKGTFGSVLAVAGSAFYRGAALLAAEGALRTGAGIVTLASVEPVVSAAVTRLPECCLCPCKEGAQGGIAPENVPLLRRQKATVLLLGPGLGGTAQSAARATETRTLVQQLLPGFVGAAVLDADGLNATAQLLAEGKPFPHPAGELVVTPHPGEMARLLGRPVEDPVKDAQTFAAAHRCVEVRNHIAAPKVGGLVAAVNGIGHINDLQIIAIYFLKRNVAVGIGKEDVGHILYPSCFIFLHKKRFLSRTAATAERGSNGVYLCIIIPQNVRFVNRLVKKRLPKSAAVFSF